jgi:hypothetical protein
MRYTFQPMPRCEADKAWNGEQVKMARRIYLRPVSTVLLPYLALKYRYSDDEMTIWAKPAGGYPQLFARSIDVFKRVVHHDHIEPVFEIG